MLGKKHPNQETTSGQQLSIIGTGSRTQGEKINRRYIEDIVIPSTKSTMGESERRKKETTTKSSKE
jgi:hypothetical protein